MLASSRLMWSCLLLFTILVPNVICDSFPQHAPSQFHSMPYVRYSYHLERRFTNGTTTNHSSNHKPSSTTISPSSSRHTTLTSHTLHTIATTRLSTSSTAKKTANATPLIGHPERAGEAGAKAPDDHDVKLSTAAKIGLWLGVGAVCVITVAGLLWAPRRRTARRRTLEAKALTKFEPSSSGDWLPHKG